MASHLSHYTRTLIRQRWSLLFICLLSCLLLFGIDPVHAQDPTPTETPTWEPIFQTPTVKATKDLSCPADGSQPLGYGTITPVFGWELDCYNCITPVSQATWAALPTFPPTQTITGTLPATQTTTPIPATATPGYFHYYTVSVGTQSFTGNNTYQGLSSEQWSAYCYPGDTLMAYSLGSDGCCDSTMRLADNTGGLGARVINNWAKPYWVLFAHNISIADAKTLLGRNYTHHWEYTPQHFSLYTYVPTGNTRRFEQALLLCYGGQGQTATPVPTAAGYCKSVQEEEEEEEQLQLPNIMVGQSQCMQFGGWEFNITWISSLAQLAGWEVTDTMTFPGINICLRPIRFGSLNLFGLYYNLDSIAFIMAAVAGIYIAMRS